MLRYFLLREFQSQHEEKQENSQIRAALNETMAQIERGQAAVAEREAGQQIERRRRETPAAGDSRQEGQADYGGAELDEPAR